MGFLINTFHWYYMGTSQNWRNDMIEFDVVGKIQPKQRPRFKRCGGFIQTYTPQPTLDYQKLVADTYTEKYGDMVLDGALIMEIDAFFNVPKSYSKKKKAELRGRPNVAHNGDIDNVAKSILDGLNGVAYDDDTIIYDLHIRKYYAIDDIEHVEIRIWQDTQ